MHDAWTATAGSIPCRLPRWRRSTHGRRMHACTQVVLERVKGAERLPGVDEILLPGERGGRMAAERLARGVMPVEEALVSGLRTMAAKYDAQGSPKAAKSAMHVATQLVHPKTSIQVRALWRHVAA